MLSGPARLKRRHQAVIAKAVVERVRSTTSKTLTKSAKLSDIKVGDRIRLHGGTGIVRQRTRGAGQLEVVSDHNGRRIWITDAKFWFDSGDLQKIAKEKTRG